MLVNELPNGGKLKIESVQFVGLRSPLDPPAKFSWGTAESRNVGLVKVETSSGIVGWGETSVTFPLWSMEERASTINTGLAPLVEGKIVESVPDIQKICRDLEENLARLRLLWSSLAVSAAIGSLEMALIDALGKQSRMPIWEMLGSERQPIDLYAVGFTGNPEEAAAEANQALDNGYSAVKIRAGFGEKNDIKLLQTFRERLGSAAEILVDVNMGWTLEQAIDMIPKLQEYDAGWIEEPLSRDDTSGQLELRQMFNSRFAAGENSYNAKELQQLIDAKSIDVLMPDLARCGGFLTALDAARKAIKAGLEYSTHHYASDIGFSAMVNLCTVCGHSAPILRDISAWPLRESLMSEPLEIRGGKAYAYTGPGLAPAPDPKQIERYRVL